jgi:hypothetical protein
MKKALISSSNLPFRPQPFWRWLASSALAVWLSLVATAQTAPPTEDLCQHYRFFSVLSSAKLEEKLGQSALSGYRLLEVHETASGAIEAVMEDVSASGKKYEYRALPVRWNSGGVSIKKQMLDVLNDAGQRGFCFVKGSLLPPHRNASLAVVEHELDSGAKYEFRILLWRALLINSRSARRRLIEAANEGFRPVGGIATDSTLMEKNLSAPAAPICDAEPYRFLVTQPDRLTRLYKEQTDEGFRVLEISRVRVNLGRFQDDFFGTLLLEKNPASVPTRLISNRAEIAGMDQSLEQIATIEKEMNMTAADGFRICGVPAVSLSGEGAFSRHWYRCWDLLFMQFSPTAKVTYRIVHASTLPELAGRVNEAAQDGFRILAGTWHEGSLVLMEKVVDTTIQEGGKP